MKRLQATNISLAMIFALSFGLTGCGSGGGGSNSATNLTAQLVDSNVSGVTFETNSKFGTTDQNGYFSYSSSDTNIEFSVGGLKIADFNPANINSDKKVLPSDLVGVTRTNTTDANLIKMLRVLQSLDDDGNATNGINITDTIKDNISANTNLSDMSIFELNSTITNAGKTLKTERESKLHYEDTLNTLLALNVDSVEPTTPTIATDINQTYQSQVNVDVQGEVGAKIFVNGVDTLQTIAANGTTTITLDTNETVGDTNSFLITLKDKKNNTSSAYTLNINKISAPVIADTTAPTFTSSASVSADENQLSALTLQASDANTVNYSISGTDAASFTVDTTTGVVAFKSSPNYENKTSYTFTATASDGTNSQNQTVTIDINNIVEPFITVWETNSTNQDITIPINSAYTYNYTVDWGDGTTDTALDTNATHTYSTDGNHTVKISGTFPAIQFNNSGDKTQINMISAWGENKWMDFNRSFYGCSNLELNATDNPDLLNVESINAMFAFAEKFNTNINDWNVSSVTNMKGMFSMADNFNQDISSWDVSSVTNMSFMFLGATNFNQPLNDWNVSNVTNVEEMFGSATNFNQPLNNWDVSSVTNMKSMFVWVSSFNQPLNNWDVSSVTDMSFMFQDASSFNQDLSSWDVSSVTDMTSMFFRASSFTNKDLSGWNVSSIEKFSGFIADTGSGNTEPNWLMIGLDPTTFENTTVGRMVNEVSQFDSSYYIRFNSSRYTLDDVVIELVDESYNTLGSYNATPYYPSVSNNIQSFEGIPVPNVPEDTYAHLILKFSDSYGNTIIINDPVANHYTIKNI